MNILERQFEQSWPAPAWHDVTVVLAVSGGPDSVALLRLMAALKSGGAGRLIVAHYNHRLRGEASNADAQFVAELCARHGLPCEMGAASSDSPSPAEAELRRERYAFLAGAARQAGARHLVTAHTADDQAETILHRALRGTGLAGLAGMARVRVLDDGLSLIRPLLEIRRTELLSYLAELGQPYRHDASNTDPRYTRNRLRHELLPQLARQYNAQIVDSLLRLGELADAAQTEIERLAEGLAERCTLARTERQVRIDCRCLAGESRYLVRETLIRLWRRQAWPERAMGYAQWELLAGLVLQAAAPKQILPGGIAAARQGDQLVLNAPDAGRA